MAARRALQQQVLAALADADPLKTGLDLSSRLDEYGLEAGEIARRFSRGDELETTVTEVFRETCEIDLSREDIESIALTFEQVKQRER